MQTGEPSIVTAQNLKLAGFQASLPPGQLFICTQWQFTQMQQLWGAIASHKPVLVRLYTVGVDASRRVN